MKRIFPILISFFILIELILIFITIFIDFKVEEELDDDFFLSGENAWADSVVLKMSLDERIGQLFFLELSRVESSLKENIDTLNQKFFFSGIKFRETEVLNQLLITNYLQSKSKYPLMIGSEGPVINRDDFNLPIGSIINAVGDSLFSNYYFDQFISILKLENVNIEFSNTIDILDSTNLQRGFSDDTITVIKQSLSFRKKLHNQKIMSCLNFNNKLFFNGDSIITDSLSKLYKPFNIHKYFALQIDPFIVKEIARGETHRNISNFNSYYYGFKGLIFSQIIDTLSSVEYKLLFDSGSDVFVIHDDIEKNLLNFKELVENGQISEQELNMRVKRIILAKKWAGIEDPDFRSAEINLSQIVTPQHILLSWKTYESSLCLLKNKYHVIPFANLLDNRTHVMVIGDEKLPVLNEYLSYYMDFPSSHSVDGKIASGSANSAQNLIVAISSNISGLLEDSVFIQKLEKLNKYKNLIIINFNRENEVQKLAFADAVLNCYDNHPFSQAVAAQVIAGAMIPKGKIVPSFQCYKSENPSFRGIERLKYTIPEAVGFDSYELKRIDTLVEWAITSGAMPGGEILAAKNGQVFWYKAYGYQTYAKRRKVNKLDIYDLASISKVAATTMAAMKLYELDSISLTDSIKYYIEDTVHCTIKNHQLADFFIHKTGLPSDMPILQYIAYRDSVTGRYDKYYAEKKDSVHTVKVADNYYLRKDYLDSVVFSLYNQEIDESKPYLYSDINFNIIYDVLLRKIPGSYTRFLNSNFYSPLQLRTTGFLPIERFNELRIAPTQDDKFWRKQLLRGIPHDESAALYGGISGNAGLFSNANDLAILFQMLVNGGKYGGKKVFEAQTVEKFTSPQENSPRGLGFNRKNGELFGHSGFTGCVVWANPKSNFIFVFLSNSIHPKPTNKKLQRMKIRSQIYNLIWSAYIPNVTKLNLTSKD